MIGLLYSSYWVRTVTARTIPFCPGWVVTILPKSNIPSSWFGSVTRTTSPSFRFFLFSLHFFLCIRIGMYCLVNRFQKKLTSAWDCRNSCDELISLTLTSASSLLGFVRTSGKWFGVSSSISPASLETCDGTTVQYPFCFHQSSSKRFFSNDPILQHRLQGFLFTLH